LRENVSLIKTLLRKQNLDFFLRSS